MRSKDLIAELDITEHRLKYWRTQLKKREIINPTYHPGSSYDYAQNEVDAFRKLKTLLENGVQTVPEATHLILVDEKRDDIRFNKPFSQPIIKMNSQQFEPSFWASNWSRLWSVLITAFVAITMRFRI
jgi:hypothetical protein